MSVASPSPLPLPSPSPSATPPPPPPPPLSPFDMVHPMRTSVGVVCTVAQRGAHPPSPRRAAAGLAGRGGCGGGRVGGVTSRFTRVRVAAPWAVQSVAAVTVRTLCCRGVRASHGRRRVLACSPPPCRARRPTKPAPRKRPHLILLPRPAPLRFGARPPGGGVVYT